MDNKVYTNCADCGFKKDGKCALGLSTETQNNNLVAMGVCRFKRSLKWLMNSANNINKIAPYTLIVCLRNNNIDINKIVEFAQKDEDCRKIILLDNKDLCVSDRNRFNEYKDILNKNKVSFTVSTSKENYVKCIRSNISLINTPFFVVVPPCSDIIGMNELKKYITRIDDRCVFWEFYDADSDYYGLYLKEPYRFLYQDPSKTFNEILDRLEPYMRLKVYGTRIAYE
jgi:hypothetical protein